MKKRYLMMSSIFIIAIFLVSCVQNDKDSDDISLTISAAVSLSEALEDIKALYEADHPEVQLTFNFGGSGTLAQQIQQGAPVDLFISANEDWMATLQAEDFIDAASVRPMVANGLVLIGKKGEEKDRTLEQYLAEGKDGLIAIGHPDTVPAGKYAMEVLQSSDLYEAIEHALVFAKDVRQVLTYVETGNADYGFVYKSDALLAKESDILIEIDRSLHDSIIYPAGVLVDAPERQAAEAFLNFLHTEEAREVFESYGFNMVEGFH